MEHQTPKLLRGAPHISKVPPKDPVLFTPETEAGHEAPKATRLKPGLGRFITTWLILFVSLYALSSLAGVTPEGAREFAGFFLAPLGTESAAETEAPQYEEVSVAVPEIVIPKIGVDAPVIFPQSRDLNILNTALASGVVHYPGSALPGETGNVFIFGHSTGLPVVHNKNYEVFNRVKELKKGDVIRIRMGSREYLYLVKTLEVKAADDARIDLESDKKLLTLSTCRIIGGKESRYVVTAEFLRSYPLRTLEPVQ